MEALTPAEIFAAIDGGATVLTANKRVARALTYEHSFRQRAKGLDAWPSPKVLPWSAWLAECWEHLLYSGAERQPLLLSPPQVRTVWENVVADSPDAEQLLEARGAAAEAEKAWGLVQSWRLPFPDPAWTGEDARAFSGWAAAFAERCARNEWLDPARLPDLVGAGIRAGRVPTAGAYLLIGFDEFTPQQLELWTRLRAAGCTVREIEPMSPPAVRRARVAFAGAADEIRAAARWARRRLESGASNVGIVAPDLRPSRAAIDRIFREVLEPRAVLPGHSRAADLFNISLGLPLSDYPAIHAALLALALGIGSLRYEDSSALLRSPFIGGAEGEMTRRALLDAELARSGLTEVSCEALERFAGDLRCPALARLLGRYGLLLNATPRRQRPGAWARAFSGWLAEMGWPGDRPLNSFEYQTIREWRELLATFATLDRTVGDLTAGKALESLRLMAADAQYQPERVQAPIQILGVFEASGLRFEHLWILGMHDEAWPSPPDPNPFLPLAVQRRNGLPHSSADRELEFLRRVTGRLLSSAPEVVVSHPLRAEDRDLRPSPLVGMVPEIPPASLDLSPDDTLTARLLGSATLEESIDEQAPPVDGVAARGGARVFQLQAACPFRAFAELRLGAENLETPAPGLDPRDRGTLLHAALAALWRDLRCHEALRTLSDAQVRERIQAAVESAFTVIPSPDRVPAWHLELERRRLAAVMADWLEVERARPPFTVVESEKKRHAALGGIRFEIRIDRVDRLPGGREILIDYKSGKTAIGDWESDRPDEPQLPLYSVTAERPPAAVAFAQLKRGQAAFVGIAEDPAVLPGLRPLDSSMAEQIERWRGVLERLAADFRAGRAEPDPKSGTRTCERCPLPALCRIQEAEDSA